MTLHSVGLGFHGDGDVDVYTLLRAHECFPSRFRVTRGSEYLNYHGSTCHA